MSVVLSFDDLAEQVLSGGTLSREEAIEVLRSDDADLPALLAAAWKVRRRFHGNTVKLHVLMNARRGGCAEDCSFCVQSSKATSAGEIEPHRMETVEQIVYQAREAHARGAWKFCLVTATRSPSEEDLETVCEAVRRIKAGIPIRVCVSLGLLDEAKARRLKSAGVDRFNHNLETSERFFDEVCSTHSWRDRLETLRIAKGAGMELCCGGIVGMGESDEDVADLVLTLRELDVDSIPVNFLLPTWSGAPKSRTGITPAYALKVLCLVRLLCPDKDVRAAAGREEVLGSLQPMALYAANALFTDGYLNTPGQGVSKDRAMIRDLGFEVLRG